MNYHSARYYMPWLGRWAAADPGGMVDGVNRYWYGRCSPVTLSDGNGREPSSPSTTMDYLRLHNSSVDNLNRARDRPAELGTDSGSKVVEIAFWNLAVGTEAAVDFAMLWNETPTAVSVHSYVASDIVKTTPLYQAIAGDPGGAAMRVYASGVQTGADPSGLLRAGGHAVANSNLLLPSIVNTTALSTTGEGIPVLAGTLLPDQLADAPGATASSAGSAAFLVLALLPTITLQTPASQGVGRAAANAPIRSRTLIIDENLSPTMVEALEAEGFSAVQLAKGLPDEEIVALARQNNAVVVTNNIKDFKGQGVMTMDVHSSLTGRASVPDVVGKIRGVADRDPYHAAFTNDSNIRLIME